jgi:DNA-binding transcriptional LysR family regulator
MESKLGGLSFSREDSRAHLTDLGRLIRPHLEEVATKTGEVNKTDERFLTLENARLSLGVMCTIAPVQFASFLARFGARCNCSNPANPKRVVGCPQRKRSPEK